MHCLQYALDGSSVVAKLGDTTVLAVVQATLEAPRSERRALLSTSQAKPSQAKPSQAKLGQDKT